MIIDFHKCYGGGGSGSGVTPQEVQAQIDSALTPYWDSAATESAITQSVSGKADAPLRQTYPLAVSTQLINYHNYDFVMNGNYGTNLEPIFAPNTMGTSGQVLSTPAGVQPFPTWITLATINGSAITNGGNIVIQGGGDMSGYYTSAQTDEKIASAVTPVANHLAEVEEITASAYTELHDDILALSARTPDMSAYTPTSGFSTINGSAITNGGNIVIQGGGGDMSNYWNSAETKSYVDSAATNLQDQIDTMDEVVADALNDLNGDVAAVSGTVSDLTSGQQPVVRTQSYEADNYPVTPVGLIEALTQNDYDRLESEGLIGANTFYIIINNS